MDDRIADLFQRLIELPDPGARSRLLRREAAGLDPDGVAQLAEALRVHASARFHESVGLCAEFAALIMELGELSAAPCIHAMGCRLDALVEMVQTGDMGRALGRFDAAAAVYHEHGDDLGWAQVQSLRLVPLAELGRLDEALAAVERAAAIFEARGEWRLRGVLFGNLAFRLQRAQRYPEGLATVEQAIEMLRVAGDAGARDLPNTQMTKGMLLVNVGRAREAIPVLLEALEHAERLGQTAVSAKLITNLGRARFAVGLFARALAAYERAMSMFQSDGAVIDAALTRLLMSECLIHLKRFESAILHARGAHDALAAAGHGVQAGQALINEGQALLALGQVDTALEAFGRAETCFDRTGDAMWLAAARLQAAGAIRSTGRLEEALAIAEESAEVLGAAGAALECAQARLFTAAISHDLGRRERAMGLVEDVLAFAADEGIDHLACDAHRLQADFAAAAGDSAAALTASLHAVHALERAQSQIVAEHRADFLGGREHVYERVVDMHLEAGDVEAALAFVERAKARALVALIEDSGGVGASEPSAEDRRDAEAIEALVIERARLIEAAGLGGASGTDPLAVRRVEREIGALRDRRTVRRLDFVDGGSVWSLDGTAAAAPVPVPVPVPVPEGAAVLEYYRVEDRYVGFALTPAGPVARRLDIDDADVQALLRALNLNFVAAPQASERHLEALESSARSILGRLHAGLVAPFMDRLGGATRLFIVPHGRLHYVPFHALHDGQAYLAATHDVSYVPATRFLASSGPDRAAHAFPDPDSDPDRDSGAGGGANGTNDANGSNDAGRRLSLLSVGHTFGGRLPHAVEEARAVAALWDGAGATLIGRAATRSNVRQGMADATIVHVATHGQYVPESPLFSSIHLEDGDLTALDIFETRLRASLVTLSACRSGLSTIGGGDEIQGMIRAFLSAGARSIVASLWTLEDRSAGDFMLRFYSALSAGTPKAAALNSIYRAYMAGEMDGEEVARDRSKSTRRHVHPYYWAPYVLIGDPGEL